MFRLFACCAAALCPSHKFSVIWGRFPVFLGWTSTKHLLKDTTHRLRELDTQVSYNKDTILKMSKGFIYVIVMA